MRVMVMVKATADSGAGVMPREALLTSRWGKFNEQLVKAGMMLAGEGLHPSKKGAGIRFSGKLTRTVIDGPFAETKELVVGLLDLAGEVDGGGDRVGEALPEPDERPNPRSKFRPIFEAEDFGDALTP
jgi:hypothetical protein